MGEKRFLIYINLIKIYLLSWVGEMLVDFRGLKNFFKILWINLFVFCFLYVILGFLGVWLSRVFFDRRNKLVWLLWLDRNRLGWSEVGVGRILWYLKVVFEVVFLLIEGIF